MIFVFDGVENIVGKRRKCWLPAFSPFPTMFSKVFLFSVVKGRDCMGIVVVVVVVVVLGFNATLTAKVISWRSVTHMVFSPTQLFFLRGENMPERKFASTGDRTHNHRVMSPTRSPLSHPGGAIVRERVQVRPV